MQEQPIGPDAAAFWDRHQKLLACIVSIAILMLSQAAFSFTSFIGDASGYWAHSSRTHFGITPSQRGYVYPMLLMPLRWISDASPDPMRMLRVSQAVIYGILLPLLVPAVFQAAFGGRVSLLRRLVPVVLLAVLFPGLLVYPLSDAPALLMMLGAVLCCIHAIDATTFARASVMSACAGVLTGAAYNTRPIYLFCLLGVGLFLALGDRRKRTVRSRFVAVASFAVGVLLVALPQAVINKRTYGMASPTVITGGNNNLFANQLVWGITMQRYETSLGPVATAIYLDPAGMKLLEKIDYTQLASIPRYLRFTLQNPVEFAGLYFRHVVNGLDARDGQIYTAIPSPQRNGVALLNFCVLAFSLLVARTIPRQSADSTLRIPGWTRRSTILLGILLLPVAAIVPGAVETRFFLPLHLIAYCVISAYFSRRIFVDAYRHCALATVVVLLVVAGGFFAISSTTMSQLQYSWPANYRP